MILCWMKISGLQKQDSLLVFLSLKSWDINQGLFLSVMFWICHWLTWLKDKRAHTHSFLLNLFAPFQCSRICIHECTLTTGSFSTHIERHSKVGPLQVFLVFWTCFCSFFQMQVLESVSKTLIDVGILRHHMIQFQLQFKMQRFSYETI